LNLKKPRNQYHPDVIRILAALSLVLAACSPLSGAVEEGTLASTTTTTVPQTTTTIAVVERPATTTTLPPEPLTRFVDARTVLEPRDGPVEGLLQFRGNPSRTWYGAGPMPENPEIAWTFEVGCGPSSVGGEVTQWCGSGWTGQPVVWEREDGVTELIFGAYDHAVHFLDAATGETTRPEFPTLDINKGSVTLDPDGFPLIYFGSRDDRIRIVALDRSSPTELWSFFTPPGSIWNNDWDGNPTIIDDLLFEGGENGIFYIWKLNRSLDEEGLVQVDPELIFSTPSYDDELISKVGRNVSIEGSVAIFEDVVYMANSGGRVLGLDLTNIDKGEAPIVFDYWVGEDVDATIVIDPRGMLYVSVELEEFRPRALELGQLIKLDPGQEDPYVWGIPVPPLFPGDDGGLWATPALGDGVLYTTTHPGELLAVDTETGEVLWRREVGHHAWSSPVLVDDTLVVSINCEEGGGLRGYDVAEPATPRALWQLDLETGCIESTPAVWKGAIYVASRDGNFYAFK
jgi:outer membrane protein assembly factor BamB